MFLDSVGIILKKNELSPYKIMVLDKIQGKIECVTTDTSFSTGALITYNMRQKGLLHFMSDTNLVYIPLSLASADMLFFHHVLELIYHFTHIGNCAKEVFDLLAFLYSTEHSTMTMQSKKIFLLKLLTCMGSVPEITQVRTEFVAQLSTITMKQLSTTIITVPHEKELDRWLWCCVWQHPYVNEFKTVHFLAKNKAL